MPSPPPLPSVDVVTPCRNRLGFLVASLPSWLAHPLIRRIVVVDFQSEEPIAAALGDQLHPRIQVIRVENEPLWRQGRAQNIGLRATDAELILKLDADVGIVDITPYVEAMAREPMVFFRGSSTQGSSSGLCLVPRTVARQVGGYHDHMAGWGGDDVDFYRRLQRAGLSSLVVEARHFHEVPQRMAVKNTETPRLDSDWLPCHGDLVRQPEFSAFRNGLLARLQPQQRQTALRWRLREGEHPQQASALLKAGNRLRLKVARHNTELANLLALHTYAPGERHWQVLRQPWVQELMAQHRLKLPRHSQERQHLEARLSAHRQQLEHLAIRLGVERRSPG